jgi:hypothetical protein
VRRLVAWTAGAAGGFAVYRLLTRWREAVVERPDPRANELRARLEESRALVDERDQFESGETTVADAADPDERRRRVHEQGRAAVDEMRGSG